MMKKAMSTMSRVDRRTSGVDEDENCSRLVKVGRAEEPARDEAFRGTSIVSCKSILEGEKRHASCSERICIM